MRNVDEGADAIGQSKFDALLERVQGALGELAGAAKDGLPVVTEQERTLRPGARQAHGWSPVRLRGATSPGRPTAVGGGSTS